MSDSSRSRLVERQMRNWEIGREQRASQAVDEPEQVQDFVCLSRRHGLPDWEVAAMLSERLGWPVFGRELLDSMSQDDAIRRRVYDSMDQRDLGWVEAALRPFLQSEFGRNDYFRRLCETVLSLARQSPSVFVGRGAELMLPRDRGFRVRFVAPLENRIEWLCSTKGLSRDRANEEIEHREAERAGFTHNHFEVDADDSARFDLAINLAQFSPRRAVELILNARDTFHGGDTTQA